MMTSTITPTLAIIAFLISATVILVSIYCTIIVGTTEIWSLIWVSIIPMTLDLIIFHAFFDYCSSIAGNGEIRSYTGNIVSNLKVWMVVLLLVIILISGLFRLRLIRSIVNESLTPFSVGEALDTLPMGIAFVGDSGIILQSNAVMDDLSFVLMRKMPVNGNAFWDRIIQGNVASGYMVEGDETPIVTGPDGFVWMFRKEKLHTEIGDVNQIIAMDIANEQNLLRELEANNERLEEMNDRLKRYSDIVDDAIRQEERLQTKIRVHDEMGEALIATKMLIMNDDSPISEQEVLDRWNRDIALLKEEASLVEVRSEGKEQIGRLKDAADHLGIELQLIGVLPENPKIDELICIGIQETMTNAIQHGNATQMYVVIRYEDGDCVVSYSNNGDEHEGEVKEGGGLTLFRKSAEKTGATLEYGQGPRFNILLRIPKESLIDGEVR